MRIHTFARAALLLGATLLASCDGSPSATDDQPRVSFRYSGVFAGTFDVRAPRPPGEGPRTQPYIDAFPPADGAFRVLSLGLTNGRRDVLFLQAPTAPGDYPLGSCAGLPVCPNIAGSFGVEDANGNLLPGGREFQVISGTITVLSPTREGWVRGRFSGTAQVMVNIYDSWRVEGMMDITNGTFHVPVAQLLTGAP